MRTIDPELHEARRAQIVKAALACFRRKGFTATTTADICREAKMSSGHLFHYFRNKDDIIASVARTDRAQASAAVEKLAAAPDFVEALIEAAGADVDLGDYALDGRLALELHGEAARNATVADTLRTNYRALQDGLRNAVVAAQKRGTIDAKLDPAGTAILITAIFEGIERAAACDPALDQVAAGRSLALLLRRYLQPDRAGARTRLKSPKIRLQRSKSKGGAPE